MQHFKHSYSIALLSCSIIIATNISQVKAARKGSPGSQQRLEWCSSKMNGCVEDANNDCEDTYSSGDINLSLCKSSEVAVCKNTYGSTSDCETRDRITKHSSKAKKNNDKETILSPPRSRTRSSKDSLKQKRRAHPLKAKTAPISSDDCTAYGGTVQRDTSCASKQSCLISNNNGCISKAAK